MAYATILGTLVLAGVISSVWPAIVSVLLIALLARGFVDNIRTMRHGVITTARMGSIQPDAEGLARTERVSVDGVRMTVLYDTVPVIAILQTGFDVELQVCYPPAARQPIASALAYKPIARVRHAGPSY